MGEEYLSRAYASETPEQTRALYDAWSDSYDKEIGDNGYATPRRIAAALKRHVSPDSTILDFGCGTGLCGVELKRSGFTRVDGSDISADMLKHARAKSVYRKVWQIGGTDDPDPQPGDYDAIAACGVIGVGAAPLSVFDDLMHLLARGGIFCLSFNDRALEEPRFEARINDWVDCAAARLRARNYGAHLPKAEINSMVYVLEKN